MGFLIPGLIGSLTGVFDASLGTKALRNSAAACGMDGTSWDLAEKTLSLRDAALQNAATSQRVMQNMSARNLTPEEKAEIEALMGVPAESLMDITEAKRLYGDPDRQAPGQRGLPATVAPEPVAQRPQTEAASLSSVSQDSLSCRDHSLFEPSNGKMNPTEHHALHYRGSNYASAVIGPKRF